MKQLLVGGVALPSALVSASMAMVYSGSCSWAGSPRPSSVALSATLLSEVGQRGDRRSHLLIQQAFSGLLLCISDCP